MNTLSLLLSHISCPQQMERVLSAVLTEKELESIANRLQIIRMLSDGATQREISSQLGVGIATVTRGAQAFKDGKFDVLRDSLKLIEKVEKI